MQKYIRTRDKILIIAVLLLFAHVLSYLSGVLFPISSHYQLVAQVNMKSLSCAIVNFRSEQSRLPLSLDELLEKNSVIGYMQWPNGKYLKNSEMLYDPWGRMFIYEFSTNGFSLTSYGNDGKKGGVGQDSDVVLKIE